MFPASKSQHRRAGSVMLTLGVIVIAGGGWVVLRGLPGLARSMGIPTQALAGGAGVRDNTATAGNVNVVLFVVDTLRADRLNTYGYGQRVTSPNIDALARESVLFEQASAAAPWTLPSVASLLTSRFACEHGMNSTRARISATAPTLPRLLREVGFTTIGLYANSIVGPGLGFDEGYDFYRESFTNEGRQVRAARDAYPGRPFFLYVHNVEPHNPEYFAPEHTPGYRDVSSEVRRRITEHYRGYRYATWGDFDAGRTPGTTEVQPVQDENVWGLVGLLDEYSLLYDASVRLADERVGSVVAELKRSGEWDNTLFVLVADHGEELNEHGGWSHDQSAYEELLHVPLLVHFPGGRYAGRRVEDLVSLVDVFPTVFEVLGRTGLAEGARGSSLMPLVAGTGSRDADALTIPSMRLNVMSYYRPWKEQRGDVNIVVRRGAWKGIWNVEPATFELYDLATDSGERENLAAAQADLVALMRGYAERWYERGTAAGGEAPLSTEGAALDEDTLRNLRALGYAE